MGLRKELRETRAALEALRRDMLEWMKRVAVVEVVYKDVIDRQKLEINDLHAKLLARDLPELQTYRLENFIPKEEDYNPLADESLVGEITEIEGESEE